MRKLVLILIAFLAVVTFIRAVADTEGKTVPAAVELNEPGNG
jgi:hypothetical protein